MSTPPIIEIIPNASSEPEYQPSPDTRHKRQRLWVFVGVLCVSLAVSLGYVWQRAPLYESAASLLTVAADASGENDSATTTFKAGKSGGQPSITLADGKGRGGGIEHVNMQRQILLGVPVFEETLKRYYDGKDIGSDAKRLKPSDLHKILSVALIPETNLVELKARSPNASELAPLVNAWIDAYQALREATVSAAVKSNQSATELEAAQLDLKIRMKRDALDRFRASHDILSNVSADNTPMLRLKGVNEALNKAIETEAKAKAKLDAIRAALAEGKPVLPPEEAPGLENLEKRAQELREAQKDLQRRYTPSYLALHPQLKQIPGQLAQVEAEIRSKAESGSRAVLSQAEQEFAMAQHAATDLRQQVHELKRESTEFNNRFSEQEKMQADIEELETMHRDLQVKLAQAETKPADPYPPLQVVERAYPPTEPAWPDYWRDSGIAFGGSVVFALLFIWLYDYLTRAEEPAAPAAATLPNFQFYSLGGMGGGPYNEAAPALAAHSSAAPLALENNLLPRELSAPEIRLLLEAADIRTQQWVALLLSGLTVAEAARLQESQLDWAGKRLHVDGERPRHLPLATRLLAGWTGTDWHDDAEEVSARINCAAIDAGLPQADSINADALRHSYIAHLVRQGIRLSELERVVGRLPAKQLAAYGRYSPPGPGLAADRINLLHPALAET